MIDPTFLEKVNDRRVRRMNLVDAMPPDLRACVHDYGLSVVLACTEAGVSKPKRIRHIVETVLDEFSPTRGGYSSQGARSPGHVVEPQV
jgi:hypothetical protein